MSRKKINKRITKLIKDARSSRHRSMFFVYGEKSREQVIFLHHLLIKYKVPENCKKTSVLWCFKKESEFNIHHLNKRLKKLKKAYGGSSTFCKDHVLDHLLLSSDVQFCHYSETDKILGQTFGMLIIQDFEALTPNILARIIECVEGGGMVLFLLPNIMSLEDLFTLNMDAHSRFVIDARHEINPIFNKRFVLSLASCQNCLVLDDTLKIRLLPEDFDLAYENWKTQSDNSIKIADAISKSTFSEDIKKVLLLSHTLDQLSSLEKMSEVLKNKDTLSVVSLTSARGRGKSAVLGLAISMAQALDYSNVYVTSPHLENLQTLFGFLIKGLTTLGFKENVHYKVQKSSESLLNFITNVKISGEHARKICYLSPIDFQKAGGADLVVIDEAAAIPLPLVKKWTEICTTLMASTINGYEGTGRSLSLKLINQLRSQSVTQSTKSHILHEIQLDEAIRYANGDRVESWLNRLLCLDATVDVPCFEYAPPKCEECDLYYVNRDVLFSYNKFAEKFLQQIVSLFVSSHYKNSPNDLLMMADAPAHHVFCLLPRVNVDANTLPHVLCVIQVCLEGKISAENYQFEQSEGRRASGDLIPWIISQQFQDVGFSSLSGARVVRIATHPSYQRMGYGQHALQLLSKFYDGSLVSQKEGSDLPAEKKKVIDKKLSLLSQLHALQQDPLDYLGVSYGLTTELFKFWKKTGFTPLYFRQTTSEVTGEHSCIMVRPLTSQSSQNSHWLPDFFSDFLERFATLLMSSFKYLPSTLALSVFHYANLRQQKVLTCEQLQWFLSPRSLQRINAYCLQQVDYHLILDLLPIIARFYFLGHLKEFFLTSVQESVLLCMGLQSKSADETATELNIEPQQIMGCFRKSVRKIFQRLNLKESINQGSTNNESMEAYQTSVSKQMGKHPSSMFQSKFKRNGNFEHFSSHSKKLKKHR